MRQKKFTEKDFDALEEYLDEWAYERNNYEVGEFLESKGMHFEDAGIDDGGMEDGEYIMYSLYSIGRFDIKLYYSNIDELVSYIQYRKY